VPMIQSILESGIWFLIGVMIGYGIRSQISRLRRAEARRRYELRAWPSHKSAS
jgi:hypothetical protein